MPSDHDPEAIIAELACRLEAAAARERAAFERGAEAMREKVANAAPSWFADTGDDVADYLAGEIRSLPLPKEEA